jgi:hypothetical protein
MQIDPMIEGRKDFERWKLHVEANVPFLLERRDCAIRMLEGPDPEVAIAAIDSFLYQWYLDDFVLDKLGLIGATSKDDVVAYTAINVIIISHLRHPYPEIRENLQRVLDKVLDDNRTHPEVATEIRRYLGNMRV